jgi:hypothetical protein
MSNAGFLWAFSAVLAVCVLPLTIVYILAIARAGQDLASIHNECGNALYPFVIANCAFNWLLAITLAFSLLGLWTYFLNYNVNNVARQYEILLGMMLGSISGLYSLRSIAALAIVPVAMSTQKCSQAIARVSWGQPWLGIVGYINLAIDVCIVLLFGGLSCVIFSQKDNNSSYHAMMTTQDITAPRPALPESHHSAFNVESILKSVEDKFESLLLLSRATEESKHATPHDAAIIAAEPNHEMDHAAVNASIYQTHRSNRI